MDHITIFMTKSIKKLNYKTYYLFVEFSIVLHAVADQGTYALILVSICYYPAIQLDI